MDTPRRHTDAGVAEILEIEEQNPDIAGRADYLQQAPFQQCIICKTLAFNALAARVNGSWGQKHHENRPEDHLSANSESGRFSDLDEFSASGNIKLLKTNGNTSKYIALSHCWGGYGDQEDHLSSAENTDAGFLRPRERRRYLGTKLCPIPNFPDHWIWVRWPASDLIWSTDESLGRLWSRGWAFQELVLPSRVLEYSALQLVMWISGHPEVANSSKNVASAHPMFPDDPNSEPASIYRRWYDLVEGYSARDLTNEWDKLPAISELARKIQEISGDCYLVGIWKNDLAFGLCWRARGKKLTPPASFVAPSWSWASAQGAVTYGPKEGQDYSGVLVGFAVAADPLNPFGEVTSGSLKVTGQIRTFEIPNNTVWVKEEWDYDAEKKKTWLEDHDTTEPTWGCIYNFSLATQEAISNPRGTGICAASFDTGLSEDACTVYLLQLKVSKENVLPRDASDPFVPDGIVLQRLEPDGQTYRRIGTYGIVDAMAAWMEGPESTTLLGWYQSTITII
ncbi:hypothetical protein K469DRAFT_752157 [Zopfia rhizophila CBS 207.26]|uniref:Heterokaryon incompatibility domain-containing protein n=1 Tax=Zopfia rhizophila CBS 207.26 TaxID=1314779 RepID=A0A6A6DUA5_9PEZI|nr:hypothetical protein K469DRAFT_752157 [Zopfia rhizophila CBS 207.26]